MNSSCIRMVAAFAIGGMIASGFCLRLANRGAEVGMPRARADDPEVVAERAEGRTWAPTQWGALESTNYLIYIGNLRRFGCPEETVRDIITADIRALYSDRRKGMRTYSAEPSGGDRGTRNSMSLDREECEVLRLLLGGRACDDRLATDSEGDSESRPIGVDESRVGAVLEIERRYQESLSRSEGATGGFLTDRDRAERYEVDLGRQEELVALLGYAGFLAYEYANSPLGEEVRASDFAFASEAERREVFALLLRRESAAGRPKASATDGAEERDLEKGLRMLLGDARYLDYERTRDFRYRALLTVERRFGLREGTAAAVFDDWSGRDRGTSIQGIQQEESSAKDDVSALLAVLGREAYSTLRGGFRETSEVR